MKALNSLAMWESIKKTVETDSWVSYFNKHGADGELLDTDDTVSFINPTNNKAIKLSYDPSKKDLIDYWLSNFGDEESGSVEVLNIYYRHQHKSLPLIEHLIKDWINEGQNI